MSLADDTQKLLNSLKEVCDNVNTSLIYPEEGAEGASTFPYLTVTFGALQFGDRSWHGAQTINIIGIVKESGDELIAERDRFLEKVYRRLKKVGQLHISTVNRENLFVAYGINAGVYPPYAGFSMECVLPMKIDM